LQIAMAWGGRAERRYKPVQGMPTQAKATLEEMVAGGWAERGLQVACDSCGVKTFVPLAEVTVGAACPGCGTAAAYVGATSVDLMYRLDSLADRASDQGVLPHLAALMALREVQPDTHLRLGLDVKWPDGSSEEVDLFGYMGADVVAGEVKTSASEFTDRQLKRDVALSAKLGATLHVMAMSTLPDLDICSKSEVLCGRSGIRLLVIAREKGQGMRVIDASGLSREVHHRKRGGGSH